MSEVTASLVKELRDKTGAGMMDCKNALVETNGNIEESIDWLRKKGISGAEKKSARVAADGVIAVSINTDAAALVEINSETDFVSRNPDFQKFAKNISEIALINGQTIEELKKAKYLDSGKSVEEALTDLIGLIGENIVLRRSSLLKNANNNIFSSYIHGQVNEGLGKIGVILSLESNIDSDKIKDLGKQIAMHIAASKPMAISSDDVDPEVIERERSILVEQAKDSGKPDNIIEKMVDGRISKFFSEITLLDQTWVIDGESKVSKIIQDLEKDLSCNILIKDFKYFVLGEGIEVEKKDFATEVAEQINN
ncbi:MAG: translation elongation factor Ts [Alphaproteobacteria bacterium]|nr:translation elongation factor Ts [Alphaproteobacteria bacterium]